MNWHRKFFALFFLIISLSLSAKAQENRNSIEHKNKWRIEGGISISMFQQQVKSEVGGESGDPLINENQFGFMLMSTYQIHEYISLGLFLRTDIGLREAARFKEIDASGKAIAENQLGGDYSEFWLGPAAKFTWRQVFLELGYAVIGRRSDDGRTDIFNESGDNSGVLTVNPSVAWMFNLGGEFELSSNLLLQMRLEYRIRYYNERDGEKLRNNIEHGTQSLAPVIGVAFKL